MTNYKISHQPPRQVPKAKAQIRGCSGSDKLVATRVTILTIIVVNGMLSMNADAIPDTQRINRIPTVSLESVLTFRIMFSVCVPIHSKRPRRETPYKI